MSTAADLVKSALKKIGAISQQETPSAAEAADGLEELNDILEDWSNDGFMIFEEKIEEFTFTPGTGAYNIGTGATFDTARPQLILGAKVKRAGEATEFALDIFGLQEWGGITLRTAQSELPLAVYYNETYPNGQLNFYPVPSAANKFLLYSLKPLTAVIAATTMSYPPGYRRALKLALATALAPEFGKGDNSKLEDLANKARAAIARTNTKPVYMTSDAFGLGASTRCGYDINRGPV